MLDYTAIAKGYEGVVVLSTPAARYVPDRSGLYQIIPTPFSFSESERERAYAAYFASRRQYLFDLKRPLLNSLDASRKRVQITLQQADENMLLDQAHLDNFDHLRTLCTFFPPVYIGQAVRLRERFMNHAQGRSSDVQAELERLGLAKNLSFFRWFEAPAAALDYLEAVLIRATLPDLNTQSR